MTVSRNQQVLLFAGMLALVLVKIWLVEVQLLSAAGDRGHDDALFIRTAQALVSGNWLGAYDNLTLIKGPFYPLWIAGAYLLGAPLLLSQHLLYMLASLSMAWALRPLLPGGKSLLLVFALLLFNPMSFGSEIMPRVIREGIYPALSILCLSGAVGVYLRAHGRLRNWLPWTTILALGLPAFWLTREEGIWLLPGLFFLHIATLWDLKRTRTGGATSAARFWTRRAGLLCLPYLFLMAVLAGLATLNWQHYGVFTIVEVKSAPFSTAYGALGRVHNPAPQRYIPVPAAVRAQVYAASPAFAELRPYLDGASGQQWIDSVCTVVRMVDSIPASELPPHIWRYESLFEPLCQDLGGGWFIWALRDAAASQGHHNSAIAADAYYRGLAREISDACNSGVLDCLPMQSKLIPQINKDDLWHIADSVIFLIRSLLSFRGFAAEPMPSSGSQASMNLFAQITGNRLTGDGKDSGQVDKAGQTKIVILDTIGSIFQKCGTAVAFFSALLFAFAGLRAWRDPALWPCFTVGFAAIMTVGARLVILGIIDALSFPAGSTQYLAPLYPVMLVFYCTASVCAILLIRGLKAVVLKRCS